MKVTGISCRPGSSCHSCTDSNEVRTFFISWGLGLIKVKALSSMSNQLCAFKLILLTIKAFVL